MGSPEVRAAAHDRRALARLVRSAFRHSVRYYVQLARAPIVDRAYLDRSLVLEDEAGVNAALDEPGGKLFVGLHIGWFELPALIAVARSGRPAIVPSETVADPDLQAYMVATRRRMGLELVELSAAKRLLRDALVNGETVGILGDRDITGGGIDIELFGAPAPLAAGPALLALETGVDPYVFGVWRDANDVYHAALQQIPFPADGTRRERVTAYLEAEARAFERFVAEAPEQWLAVFHPIWPDLERAAAPRPAPSPPSESAEATERLGRQAAR
jgi:KDO2-lipid IV(A) lauroyltransferase